MAASSYPVPRAKRVQHAIPPRSADASAGAGAGVKSDDTSPRNAPVVVRRQSLYALANCSVDSLEPAYNSISCFTGGFGSSSVSVKAALQEPMPIMDPDTFHNLPPAVRRKFFSSLERLRYAQESSVVLRPPSSHQRASSSGSSRKLPPLACKARRSNDSSRSRPSSKRLKLGKQKRTPTSFILSQKDARWFLELPETIRRKHFSDEERIALASKFETIIVDSADEALYRLGRKGNRTLTTVDSCISSIASSSDDDLDTEEEDEEEEEVEDDEHGEGREHMELSAPPARTQRRQSLDTEVKRATEDFRKSFRWLDEHGDLNLQLKQYARETGLPNSPTSPKSTQTAKRTFSVSSSRRTGSSASAPCHTRRPSVASRRTTSCIPGSVTRAPALTQRSQSAHSNSVEFKDAAYYQDPEARLKLRVYLASPQKFDEAVEFGFPSTKDATDFFRPRCKDYTDPESDTSSHEGEEEFRLVDDDFGDSESMAEVGLTSWQAENVARLRSSDSKNSAPSRLVTDHYPYTTPVNREMTLKMTLTRKDLRTDDELMYNAQNEKLDGEDVPTAEFGEESMQFWDTIDKESESGLKKIWRRVTGR